MSAKFLIVIKNRALPAADKNALTAYLQGKGWEVWHWFEDLWLIAGAPPETTAKTLFDELDDVAAAKNVIVMEITDETPYWGRAHKEAWVWMKAHWGPPAK